MPVNVFASEEEWRTRPTVRNQELHLRKAQQGHLAAPLRGYLRRLLPG